MTSTSSTIKTSNSITRVVGNGYDPVDWVRQVVLPRIKRSAENGRYIFPDPLVDLQRFAHMHSWYKHYCNEPGRFYPILRIGPEKRGIVDLTGSRKKAAAAGAADTGKKVVPLHWAFVDESTITSEDCYFTVGFELERLPWQIMRDCYFFVSWEYSSFSLRTQGRDSRGVEQAPFYDFSAFTAHCALDACARVRERIVRLLLACDDNPPVAMKLTIDLHYDGRKLYFAGNDAKVEDDGEKLRINGHEYALEYEGREPTKWRETSSGRFVTVSEWYDNIDESELIAAELDDE